MPIVQNKYTKGAVNYAHDFNKVQKLAPKRKAPKTREKIKGCQLPTIEKKIKLGIGLVATQTKPNASIKDTDRQK